MQPVSGGTQKVTFNKEDDREYEALKRATQAQAASNPYVQGVGMEVKDSRSPKYGNPEIMPEELIEGAASNFSQSDAPGNAPREELNQSGSLETGVSGTTNPQEDPQSMQADALSQRLEIMRRGGQYRGLNDQSKTYGA